MHGQVENAEVLKRKCGNGSAETEVRKRKYGNESRPAVGKVLRLDLGYSFSTLQVVVESLLSLHRVDLPR